jgi:phosphatidylserine/phosphatidylglycerophosphate/cardiolipin synthase-like enzyme
MTDVPIAIARTAPRQGKQEAVRENESLYLRAIRSARDYIYLENQYFSSISIGDALAARLQARCGPEIVVVCPARSPNFLDGLTMDPPRDALVARLHAADRHGRFHVFSPVTQQGRPIIVHSKISVIDDRLLRVGSANLSNRSMGFDTECDIAVDALCAPAARVDVTCTAIRRFCHGLIGHHLQHDALTVAQAIEHEGSYAAGIRRLCDSRRNHLVRFVSRRPSAPRRWVAKLHLGDPANTSESFRPWRRASEHRIER